jgi:uncharacterized protein YbjT (DUF2867 family)
MTVLVTGATGSVGRHVVAGLLAAGEPVRALTRDSANADLPRGVELVTADLADPATLTPQLFDGVDRVLVFPADCGVAGLMSAAVAAGIERYVVLSSLAAALEHPRDIGSASAVHHLGVEDSVASRTDGWAIVRPGTFANNLLSWAYNVKTGLPIRAPYLRSAQAPIHEADVADAMLALLGDFDLHRGAIVAITGPEALTRREQVTVIGEAVGSQIELVEISPDEFRQEMSQFIPESIMKMLLDYWRDTVTEPDKVRSIRALCGHDARTLAQWARDHRADFGAIAD